MGFAVEGDHEHSRQTLRSSGGDEAVGAGCHQSEADGEPLETEVLKVSEESMDGNGPKRCFRGIKRPESLGIALKRAYDAPGGVPKMTKMGPKAAKRRTPAPNGQNHHKTAQNGPNRPQTAENGRKHLKSARHGQTGENRPKTAKTGPNHQKSARNAPQRPQNGPKRRKSPQIGRSI